VCWYGTVVASPTGSSSTALCIVLLPPRLKLRAELTMLVSRVAEEEGRGGDSNVLTYL